MALGGLDGTRYVIQMRHSGILQYSLKGAQLRYREITQQAMGRLGAHHHPVITMTGLSMHRL
jgi:aspartate racemase